MLGVMKEIIREVVADLYLRFHIQGHEFKISKKQLDRMSTLFLEIGLIVFASFVISPLLDQSVDFLLLFVGGIISFLLWYTSIRILH